VIQRSLLLVEDLSVAYRGMPAVHGLSFAIARGEAYGLVGESGSGKTTVAMAIVRHLATGGLATGGRIVFGGADVTQLDAAALRAFRGRRVAMVYQNPAAALDPSMRIGDQVAEVFTAHAAMSASDARQRALDMLRQVQLSEAEAVYRRYPHQLSGGMQQRVVIAMALAAQPELLILDEPTTGLDATVEAAILALLAELRQQLDLAVLLISHNLAVVSQVCNRVGVLYAGRLVEEGPVDDVFDTPAHPYTRGLLASLPGPLSRKGETRLQAIPGQAAAAATRLSGCMFAPRCGFARERCTQAEPLLLSVSEPHMSRCYFWDEVVAVPETPSALEASPPPVTALTSSESLLSTVDVRKTFRVGGDRTIALDGVTLDIPAGRTLGLVGESGSGKSTLARVIAGLDPLDSGKLNWDGQPLDRAVQKRERGILRQLQMVFQDPDSTLNPRHTIRTLLERSIRRLTDLDKPAREARAIELLAAVDLEPRFLDARPAELSGGQRQRVAIARAFAGAPALVLCDEPTSALDASVQANVLNLFDRLQRDAGAAYLFISHDIGVVRYLADMVGVLYLGRLMQLGTAQSTFAPPHHPYTEVLLESVPRRHQLERVVNSIRSAPAPSDRVRPKAGCPFQATCPRKLGTICETQDPPWRETGGGGGILCHIPLEDLKTAQLD
jgi:peptide/nickel transport system ATP-binding protein